MVDERGILSYYGMIDLSLKSNKECQGLENPLCSLRRYAVQDFFTEGHTISAFEKVVIL
jgi:hypothetical protein